MNVEAYIKKYFWLLKVVVVMVCAGFTATTVAHVVEAAALTDSDKPSLHRKAATTRPPTRPGATHSNAKDGSAFITRNMFCSECVPVEPVTPATDAPYDSSSPPLTQLPLRLVATNVAGDEKWSFATVLNTSSNVEGAYWLGDEIPAAGKVVHIFGRYLDFENPQTKRLERVSLLADEPARPAPKPAAPATNTRPKNELMAAVEEGVKKVSDTSFEIDRALVDKVLANPTAVARGARVVPSMKDGKPNGFKLYAIRPTSVYSKIGLQNGDTLHAVNGLEINSMQKALEVYTKVKSSSSLSVNITRRGKPVTISYQIK